MKDSAPRTVSGMPPDEQLAALAKNGDEAALETLIHRYLPLASLRARAFAKGALDREDLSQEALIALLAAVRHYRPEASGSFKTFATVCINNKLITAVKSHLREKNTPMRGYIPFDDVLSESLCVPADEPGNILIRSEEAATRRRQIADLLSPFEREVLTLYLHACSYEEMSARLDSSRKAVDNALQRIRRKLRAAFTAE